jgi:putative transposase
VIERMQRELSDWLRIKGLPPTLAELSYQPPSAEYQAASLSLSQTDSREFKKLKDRSLHFALDECHGRSLLKNRELANIVASAILHGNGKQYDVESFVVMPNHVHAIAQFYKESSLSIVGQSWMRYTARQINASISESGAFWQPEPFDHLIRSGEQFRYLQHYIADNPRKAGLGPDSTLYWSA